MSGSGRGRGRAWRRVAGAAAGLVLVGALAACGGGSSGGGGGGSGGAAGVSGGATVRVSQDDLDGLSAATSDAERTAAQAEHDLASDD